MSDVVLDPREPEWDVVITHDGLWPSRWNWRVSRWDGQHIDSRSGSARTRDKAQRKAAAARVDIERNDLSMRLP